ncbi:helix-turn-helix transcriptional regulator [Clostridium sp. SHJSY1]|uniref:helix-turn-helix domain-containing protein n=1 Tax=Clostridium sp. SHJSY1 TaxID=2942483 RepID=UPI002876C334|nr:helix-turn-helix transcriptional regulator [Clostridium sp. SHJSY1]MDS0526084.1 helix-turn-helix transcriptional regulator [Clostridium sp. SHJSY1]
MKIDNKKLDIAMAYSCLSVNELSRKSGVNIVTLTRVRKGTQDIMPKTVGKIAKALETSVEEIIQD